MAKDTKVVNEQKEVNNPPNPPVSNAKDAVIAVLAKMKFLDEIDYYANSDTINKMHDTRERLKLELGKTVDVFLKEL